MALPASRRIVIEQEGAGRMIFRVEHREVDEIEKGSGDIILASSSSSLPLSRLFKFTCLQY